MEIYKNKIKKLISKSKNKIIFESFFKIIFKILEVNGKKKKNYSIRSQTKMMISNHL